MTRGQRSVLYFAYGSNILSTRIRRRIGDVRKVATYLLPNYELVFDYGNYNCSFANIKPSPGKFVYGVIYEMTLWQLKRLDMYEGYRKGQFTLCYRRDCVMYKGRKLHYYISDNRRGKFEKPITVEYYQYLVAGAIENNMGKFLMYLLEIKDKVEWNSFYI